MNLSFGSKYGKRDNGMFVPTNLALLCGIIPANERDLEHDIF
jgi:hypothetical protein